MKTLTVIQLNREMSMEQMLPVLEQAKALQAELGTPVYVCPNGQRVTQVEDLATLQDLVASQQKVIAAQTDTITRLVAMMSEEEGDPDAEPDTYMDGSRRQ